MTAVRRCQQAGIFLARSRWCVFSCLPGEAHFWDCAHLKLERVLHWLHFVEHTAQEHKTTTGTVAGDNKSEGIRCLRDLLCECSSWLRLFR
jgi:hypothetical protein